MGNRFTVLSLPKELLSELNRRLVDSEFGDYDSHVEWLNSLGFSTSRSSIHRYAQSRASSLLSSTSGIPPAVQQEVRLRCLEISAAANPTCDPDELIKFADSLLKWTCSA